MATHIKTSFRSRSVRALFSVTAAAIIILGPVLGAPTVTAATPFTEAAPTSPLQQNVNKLRNAGSVGVLAEVLDDADSLRARAGVAERGTTNPVPWDGHFRTGSTTKTFVSTVMLQLVGEGKLSLGDTVERWLPGLLQGNGYDGSKITVRQILNQTSGIYNYTDDSAFFATLSTARAFSTNWNKTYTPQQLINIAKSHRPSFAPGTNWGYSNTNYIVAGLIIKAVTGNTWDTEVKNRIITPLGLTGTSSPGTDPTIPSPLARGYHIYSSTSLTYTDTTLHNMSWAGSAGDLIVTTHDENRFFRALMRGQLLAPAQLAQMKTLVVLGPGAGYGLGIVWYSLPCDSRGYWSHDGGTVGYSASGGVTDDGGRSVVVSLSTTTFNNNAFSNGTDTTALVTNALCTGGK